MAQYSNLLIILIVCINCAYFIWWFGLLFTWASNSIASLYVHSLCVYLKCTLCYWDVILRWRDIFVGMT